MKRNRLGAPPPAYTEGRTIANLAAHIGNRFGAAHAHGGLAALADSQLADHIAGARHVVLLLLDGLGCAPLDRLNPAGTLAAMRCCELDSTFPSSTAPAVTTFATGLAPGGHAVTGWHLWSPAHRAVVRPLPLDYWGMSGSLEARDIFQWQPLSARMHATTTVLQPAFIANSPFTRHAFAGAHRLGYSKLDEIRQLIVASLTSPAAASHYVYAYLPQFDTAAHEHGWASEPARKVALAFDALFADLADALAKLDVLLLATADHGFVDVPDDQLLRLEHFPKLAAMLDTPLTGEPRVAFCNVRTEFEDEFAQAVTASLGGAFECHRSEQLIRSGYFGPLHSDALRARIGSHTLIGQDRYCLTQTLPGETPATFVGMHGGMHADEMRVAVAASYRGNRIGVPPHPRTRHA